MKPQELRVGNLISFKGKWNGEVEEIKSGSISIKDNEGIFPYDAFEPILLTEEWLLKYGFKQYETVGIKTHNYIKGNFKFNSAVLWVAEYKGIHIENKILYVHQLQNLYFALTGEELKLK